MITVQFYLAFFFNLNMCSCLQKKILKSVNKENFFYVISFEVMEKFCFIKNYKKIFLILNHFLFYLLLLFFIQFQFEFSLNYETEQT